MAPLSIRPVEPGDRDAIHWIVASTENLAPVEVDRAIRLVDNALAEGEAGGYLVHLLEDAGIPVGFICFGPTPLTEGTWNLHWIAVQTAGHGKGYGRHLLAYAESEIRHRGGRLVLFETSSQDSFAATAGFFERTGYRALVRIPGFYRVGVDKLIFIKELEPEPGSVSPSSPRRP